MSEEQEVIHIVEPEIRRPVVPPKKTEWATPPVPLIGLPGVDHQWIRLHSLPLFGTFVDKPTWVLVPDNWRGVYAPWQIDMLEKTYVQPIWIREMRLVEVNYAGFRRLCYEKDLKKMAWHLSYYGKDPVTRKHMLDYWEKLWGEPYPA